MSTADGTHPIDGKYELLSAISNVLIQIGPLSAKLDMILAFLGAHLNLHHTIVLLPKDQNQLEVMAINGYTGFSVGVCISSDHGFIGAVAKNKKLLKISRLSQYRRFISSFNPMRQSKAPIEEYPTIPNAESLVVIPMVANDELVAILSCESENLMFFDQQTEDLLTAISNQIALSIQNSILFDQFEERIMRRTNELQKANAAKDRLFSIIAHDIRSPLTSLDGISGLLDKSVKEKNFSLVVTLVKEIEKNTDRVRLLLDNLLGWSLTQRQEIKCNPQRVEITPVMNEVVSLFEHQAAGKELQVITDGSTNSFAHVDYQMFFSILRNILSNAIKFSKQKGTIKIDIQDRIDMVDISVRDEGIGIPKTQLANLFDLESNRSTIGTSREKGSGLGLVLVHDFIKMNSGRLYLKSSTQGTTVTIMLPKN